MQPKEQTKAQRKAISRMLQKSPGLPQPASKSNAGRRAERYRQPQETERLRTRSLQPGNGTTDRARDWNIVIGENKVKIKLVVLCHNNTQGSVFAPPHPLLLSKNLVLNPTGDRILSQPCTALYSQAVPTATPGSEL